MSSDGDSEVIKKSQEEVNAGLVAIRQGMKDVAGTHFWYALQQLDKVNNPTERRNLYSEISELFLNTSFEDLALMAVLDALDADKELGLQRGLIKDSMTYANIHTRLGNLEESEAKYQTILQSCLKNGDYANAASASTNLAGIFADENYLEEATQLLQNSLDYLKGEDFPGTEINTYLMLIQVMEVQKREPEHIFATARMLLDRLYRKLQPQHCAILTQSIESTLNRYSQKNIEIDVDNWRKEKFPELYRA